jgi:hypothetical protein
MKNTTKIFYISGGKIMSEQQIENFIGEVLTGGDQKNALEFIAYLKASEMIFERGKGYWEGKLHWIITYKDESVCYILIGSEEKPGPGPWIVWSDDSGTNSFKDFPLDEHMKEIAWKNIDICVNCGGCDKPGGNSKTIFGKEFTNVCRTTMRFTNPDVETLEYMKKMVEIRKNYILRNI